MNMRTQVW